MQIKTTRRRHLTSVKMATINIIIIDVGNMEKMEPSVLVVGMSTATIENSTKVLWETKNRTARDPAILWPSTHWKESQGKTSKRYLSLLSPTALFTENKKIKMTERPTDGWSDKQHVTCLYKERWIPPPQKRETCCVHQQRWARRTSWHVRGGEKIQPQDDQNCLICLCRRHLNS